MSNNNEHVDYTEFESWLNEYMPEEDNVKGEKVRVKGILATKERNFSFLDVPGLPTSVRVRTEELENYNEGDEVSFLLDKISKASSSFFQLSSISILLLEPILKSSSSPTKRTSTSSPSL